MKKELYKKTKTGAIQHFIFELVETMQGILWEVVISKGQYPKGKYQVDTYPFSQGKNIGKVNETNPKEQAIVYMNGRINGLRDEGYKDTIEQCNTKYKTDANGRKLVMLAAKNHSKVKFPCYVQRKYDGMRCVASKEQGTILLRTRNGKMIGHLTHLEDQIKILGNKYELDGELYCHGKTLREIISMVKREQVSNSQIQYRVYDVISEQLQGERLEKVKWAIKICGKDIIEVPTYKCNTWDDIKTLFAQFIKEGYEGAIIRNPDGLYECGYRSNNLIKYKHFEDEEFEIVSANEATGRDKGTIIFVCKTKAGKEFRVRPQGTREERGKWWDTWKTFIGKKLTVRFVEYTEYGIPFHPVGLCVRDYE
jgi:ATP-dependent DNA ligase